MGSSSSTMGPSSSTMTGLSPPARGTLVSHAPQNAAPGTPAIRLPQVAVTSRNRGRSTANRRVTPFRLLERVPLARRFGAGAYGEVFLVKKISEIDSQSLNELRRELKNRVGDDEPPPPGADVVIKISKRFVQEQEQFVDFASRMITEVLMHVHVHRAVGRHPCRPEIELRGASITPRVFFSGTYGDGETHVTVMELAPGETLAKYVSKYGSVPRLIQDNIENAVLTLWFAAGIIHADLHFGNVMVNERTGEVKIIDFGFAVMLPEEEMDRLKRAMQTTGKSTNAWNTSSVQPYVSAVHRNFDFYNPNGKALKVLFDKRAVMEHDLKRQYDKKAWASGLARAHRALQSPIDVLARADMTCSTTTNTVAPRPDSPAMAALEPKVRRSKRLAALRQ
jgi:hypothetical protein